MRNCALTLMLFCLFLLKTQGQDWTTTPGGFYSGKVVVHIADDFDLYAYSLDGSKPRGERKVRGGDSLVLKKTTVVRLRPMRKKRILDTAECVQGYFLDFETSFSVLSLVTDPPNLYDPKRGIYVAGEKAYETEAGFVENANYQRKWERPVHVQFYDQAKTQRFSQAAGIRIFGGTTRAYPEKALRIIARDVYGKDRFNYPFFQEKNINEFKSLVIRASGNDFNDSRIRDVMTTQLSRGLDVGYQGFHPVMLFINGTCKGVYHVREKINARFLEDNFKANPDSVDILQGRKRLEAGTVDDYSALLKFLSTHDLSIDSNYSKVESWIDIQNFINYRAIQVFIANPDSRGNIRYWRDRAGDGKWRWILYDTDFGFGEGLRASYNYLEDCLSPIETRWYNPPYSTLFLRKLLENKQFEQRFVSQFVHIMNTNYSKATVYNKIDWFERHYEAEMKTHYSHVKHSNMKRWRKKLKHLRDFGRLRHYYMRKHLKERFGVKGEYLFQFEEAEDGLAGVKINETLLQLDTSVFEGKYFKGYPLVVEVWARAGYDFKGYEWVGTDSIIEDVRVSLWGDLDTIRLKPIFERKEVQVVEVAQVVEPKVESGSDWKEWVELSKHYLGEVLLAFGLIFLGWWGILFKRTRIAQA